MDKMLTIFDSDNKTSDEDGKFLGIQFNLTAPFDDVPLNGDFYWLLTCLCLCIIWIIYIIFYNSRIFGLILTKLINHVIIPRYLYRGCKKENHPYLHIGSFSLTIVSGKIMFRDLIFITADYSLRIQDGWMIFRWWVPYEPKNVRETDFSHSDTRVSFLFNGFELHIFNRSELYAQLERVFHLPTRFQLEYNLIKEKILKNVEKSLTNDKLIKAYLWKDFFPVTKFEINSGRLVFGNSNLPTTLLVTFEEFLITYTSKSAVSEHDLFTHTSKCKAENFKIILANSPNHKGVKEEPPRYMGEGFVVFQSNLVEFYYYQDEPGFASSKPEIIEVPLGDTVERFTSPEWGLEVKSGKGTDLRYGPWADRQRDYLYNFFYPPDFQNIPATTSAKDGEIRFFEKFDFKFSTTSPANIDILFTDLKRETNVMHLTSGPGSYLEVSVPLISKETGYYSDIIGQILHLDSTTTLAYRPLAESETLEFKVRIEYPRMWNHHQTWHCNFTGCKTSVNLIYAHKIFFQSLIDDWAGKDRPDILKFVPYTCKINLILKEFEIITVANEYNWIDCTSKTKNENIELAICGDTYDMAFDLSFAEFLPEITPYKIWIQGESLQADLHVPEINPHYETIRIMDKFAKMYPLLPNNDLNLKDFLTPTILYARESKWRNITKPENNWITCWSVPIVAIDITYHHHPVPVKVFKKDDFRIDDELNLKNNRFLKNFDPGEMQPDLAEIEIEIGPSKICLHGLLLRTLWNIKENYMGQSQMFNDFSMNAEPKSPNTVYTTSATTSYGQENRNEPFDDRLYRPFAVTVSVIMHDLHGHLMKNCFEKDVNNEDPLCPYVYLEKLCFEMDKTYRETKLQLVLSPVIVRTSDLVKRPKNSAHLNNGHLLMNSLQFRGHALFSGVGRSLESETLEYGWLVEVEIGKLSGKLTTPQLYHITCSLETFIFQLIQPDSSLQPPMLHLKCLHDKLQSQCPESDSNLNKICPNAEDIKYKMVRFSVQSVDLCLVESNNLLYLQISPIRFSTCNLHSCHSNNGITLLINNVFIKHFVIVDSSNVTNLNNTFKQPQETPVQLPKLKEDLITNTKCYEALNIEFGPVFVDTAELLSVVESYTISQEKFLHIHDSRVKRLWFIWNDSNKFGSSQLTGRCGCVGGCAFFGNNLNGRNFFNLNSRDAVDGKIYEQRSKETITEKFEKGYDFMYGESLLNPGEPILGLKLNSINEESEENLNTPPPTADSKFSTQFKISDPPLSASTFRNSPALTGNRTSSPFYLSKVNSMSPSLFNANRTSKFGNLSYFAMSKKEAFRSTDTQSQLASDGRRLPRNHLFSDKNRSLSETGIEKSSKFDKPDRLSKLKELPIEKQQASKKMIKESGSASIKSQQSVLTMANDRYFSAEELTPNQVKNENEEAFKSISNLDSQSEDLFLEDESKEEKNSKSSNLSINSSNSFRSACSSPKELQSDQEGDVDYNEEDNESIYDLRDQMERPIIESPLLMSTYSNYLTLYQCENWWPKKNDSVNLLNSNYIPIMKQTTFDGFSSIGLIKKRKQTPKRLNRQNQQEGSDEEYAPGSVYERIPGDIDTSKKEGFHKTHRRQDSSERVMNLGQLEKQISKTIEIRNEKVSVLVKINGDTEVKISPLCLDGLKTFIEALTPTLAKAHPLTIINHINILCHNNVESKNHLKKGKTLEYGQLKLKGWHSTMERERGLIGKTSNNNQNNCNHLNSSACLNSSILSNQQQSQGNQPTVTTPNITTRANFFEIKKQQPSQKVPTVFTENQFEETKNTKFQLFVQISNINIYVLQASLVEQLVDSSTIEHLNDCTCVSLLALNIGRSNFEYCNNKKERRSLHSCITNNLQTPPEFLLSEHTHRDFVAKWFSKKEKKEQIEIKPLTIETQELLLEESVGMGSITKMHVQLNRLKNSSSLLNDALLTIIPKNNSKVDFEIVNLVNPQLSSLEEGVQQVRPTTFSKSKGLKKSQSLNPKFTSFNRQECSNETESKEALTHHIDSEDNKPDLLTGFIMFEAGIENIRVNGVKKKIITDEKSVKNQMNNQANQTTETANETKNEEKDVKTEEIKNENEKHKNAPEKDQTSSLKNNASSLGGTINVIWFNFAAPPKTPNTKKIDFTKLDWHLISTATPAINAWLNSGDRILLNGKKCILFYERRVTSVLACLMSTALEIPGIHIPPKSRYWTNRLTPFSKSLHEDPSCQLMAVLRRYLSRFDTLKEIEQDLDTDSLPPLKILRKGVISLSRSWKNALYMPLLVEQNIKFGRGEMGSQNQSKIPLRLLINENNANLNLNEVQMRKSSVAAQRRQPTKSNLKFPRKDSQPKNANRYDTVLFMNQELDEDNINEKTNLLFDEQHTGLMNDEDDILNLGSEQSSLQGKHIDELSNESSKPRFIPNMFPRGSLAFPLLTNPLESLGTGVKNLLFNQANNCTNGTTVQSKQSKRMMKSDTLDDSSDESDRSSEFNLNMLNDTQLNNYKRSNEENLYRWTIKHQDYMNSRNLPSSFSDNFRDNLSNTLNTNKHSTLRSATSDELDPQLDEISSGFIIIPTGIQLGDVSKIFEPLLVSLAIDNLDDTDSNIAFEQLGTKISLSLIVRQFKIEIVESEFNRGVNKTGHSPHHQPVVNNPNEPSAFECDCLNIGLNLRKVKDFKVQAGKTDANKNTQTTNETEKMPIIIVGPEGGLSEVTTIVNFNVETNRIIQRVNLPLLRLIHQVASVFENVKETRLVMKSNKVNKWKQSVFLGDLKNEQLLSFSLNSNQANNRQSTLSNATSSSKQQDHVTIDIEAPGLNQLDDEEKVKRMPICWKNMYCLLNLYETTPETKTVSDRNRESYLQQQQMQNNNSQQQLNYSDINQHSISHGQQPAETRIQIDEINRKRHFTGENQPANDQQHDEFLSNELRKSSTAVQTNFNTQFRKSMVNVMSSDQIKTYTQVLMQRELTPFVIFGVVKIKKVNLEAKLSSLKLDGELSSFHVSLTHKEKVKGASVQAKKWKESSLTAQLGSSKISIFEETQYNNHQLIVEMTIGKSLTLISSQNKKGKDHNSALLKIGAINIDIPQHPVALHGMMTRSSRQLSTTLQEFKTQRGVYKANSKTGDNFDQQLPKQETATSKSDDFIKQKTFENTANNAAMSGRDQFDSETIQLRNRKHHLVVDKQEEKFIRPIVVQFHIVLDSFQIGASLLPSLSAQYSIGQVTSAGVTGHKAKFTIDFDAHKLSFNTKVKPDSQTDANLPSSASVSLPKIHVLAEYMEEAKKKTSSFISGKQQTTNNQTTNNSSSKTNAPGKSQPSKSASNNLPNKSDSFADGIVLRKGSYLNALAEIGGFEHSLTTDLLNHLLLVQKVFMKEVNEILQKMSGFDQKSQKQTDYSHEQELNSNIKQKPKGITTRRYLLFTLHLRMKGIQITATTPTNSAVRLETGKIDLQLSNRVQNMLSTSTKRSQLDLNLKLFIKLQVDLMVALGQLFQNPMYEEATPEFQQLAYFRTRIVMRNALQDELISSNQDDNSQEEKEAVLIVLKRPLLYIQPVALDKAVLVWLNYKNAYEYWNEQRASLNTEVKSATQQVLDKMPINQLASSGSLGTLFLQLTIDDLGICLPIVATQQPQFNVSSFTTSRIAYDSELKSAFVITLESTSISACVCTSWASKARFTGLCIRFADDFETSLDDWKPDPNGLGIMNLCVVSGGTYEICSKTTTPGLGIDAKWLLNVSWCMDGFDIHVDTSIGKQLSALFKTLTALAGEQDELESNRFYLAEEDQEKSNDNEISVDRTDYKVDLYSSSLEKKKKKAPLNRQSSRDAEKKPSTTDSAGQDEEFVFRKPSFLRDTSIDNKKRSRLIEKELNDQVKLISDLKQSGASEALIDQETRKFNELEALVFNDFRRDVIKKFRRQSIKKAFKDRSSEGSKSSTHTPYPTSSSKHPLSSVPQSFSIKVPGHSESLKSDTSSKLPFLKESSSLDSSNDIGPLSPTESEINSPLTKSYSKDNTRDQGDQSGDEDHDSLYYLNTFLPKNFYRYKSNPINKTADQISSNMSQSTSEHAVELHSSNTESNLFSNLMNLPSFINTSFSSSALPTTDNMFSKLFNLSPAHKKSSSSKLSSNQDVFEFDDDTETPSTPTTQSKHTSPLVNEFLSSNQTNSSSTYLVQEPNIDFELDVKIYFNSGKCVLHTKDPASKDDSLSNKKSASLPKERSFSSNPFENLQTPQGSFYGQHQTAYNKFYRTSSSKAQANTSGTNYANTAPTGGLKFNTSSSRLRAGIGATSGAQNLLDYTVFLIPGLDIKLHYNSRTVFPNLPSNISHQPSTSHTNQLAVLHENLADQDLQRMKRFGTKKATCYAWMTLHSIPEETVITPHLLDFLEEALEPIPIVAPPSRSPSQSNLESDSNEQKFDTMSVPAQYAVYGSFPVDVIVYLHVQQSVLRFSCLPISRVECLLQLPSVDLVFSSKRIEDELSDLNQSSTGTKQNIYTHKRTQSVPGSVTFNNKFGHRRLGSDYRHHQGTDTSVGGLSVTGYLADFSLYIFHPYTNTKTTVSSKLQSSSTATGSTTPKVSNERKDSLSLQVEFVKMNISRSRKVTYSYNQSNLFEFSKPSSPCSNQRITIRFSGLCDIGSASFKYDIRRLSEILAFPKAWYRKTLWKRIFLGDQGVTNEVVMLNTSNIDLLDVDMRTADEELSQDEYLGESDDDGGLKIKIDPKSKLSPDQICEEITNERLESKAEDQNIDPQKTTPIKTHHRTKSSDSSSITHQQKKQLFNTPWETLILFGVNLSKLNVHMNMGNIMGNTNWLTREFRSEGKIMIDSTGHRAMNISLGLDNSTLDAKSGIVGGQIELSKIETKLNVKEYYGMEPDHVITARLNALQTRIDYMGSPILMLRMSNLDLRLKDEWKIDTELKKSYGHDHPTKRPALMFIHCVLSWDQLQILLSKSTTPDIIKIITKLDEFFSKQFNSGKRVFTSLQKNHSFNRQSFKRTTNKNQQQQPSTSQSNNQLNQDQQPKRPTSQLGTYQDAKHHRHWQKTLKSISGVYLHNFPDPLPEIGTILGGTFELYGNNISIACFADINFRSKSWAIFSLRYPHISFATEAQESLLMDDQSPKTHIIQNFSLSLGRRQNQEGYLIDLLYATHSSMATVCKISRNTMFSPQFKHLHEWFQYAFCASELDEVDRFPVIEFERFASETPSIQNSETTVDGRISNLASGVVSNVVAGVAAAASSSVQTLGATFKKHQEDSQQRRLNSPKTNQLNHTKEIIFALPSLQLELKTEHVQDAIVPISTDPKPKVDCAFVTDFDDHIFVAVDIEAYFFLHNLISSYIKEKEVTFNKAQSPVVQSDKTRKSKNQAGTSSKDTESNEEKIETDWREYNCQTWHLEPTVRLLSWAVKNIEPYGVDYILQRLGFTQARITIPKWIQRGAMDPLDRVLSELMYHNIMSNKKNSK